MSIPSRKTWTLPPIPDKPRYTPGDVARIAGIKMQVLRQWSTVFPELRQEILQGNIGYYMREHVELICRIKSMLERDGYSLTAIRKQLEAERQPAPEPVLKNESDNLIESAETNTDAVVETAIETSAVLEESEGEPDFDALEAFINGAQDEVVAIENRRPERTVKDAPEEMPEVVQEESAIVAEVIDEETVSVSVVAEAYQAEQMVLLNELEAISNLLGPLPAEAA